MMFGMLLGPLFLVLIGVWLWRQFAQQDGRSSPWEQRHAAEPQESPREILRHRFAAGEIDREEYLQRLEDL